MRALKGEEHLSVSQGSLGESLRGFVPVYDQGKQIGVVAMGIKMTSLSQLIERTKNDYTVSVLLSVGFGFILAIVVSYYLKTTSRFRAKRNCSSIRRAKRHA